MDRKGSLAPGASRSVSLEARCASSPALPDAWNSLPGLSPAAPVLFTLRTSGLRSAVLDGAFSTHLEQSTRNLPGSSSTARLGTAVLSSSVQQKRQESEFVIKGKKKTNKHETFGFAISSCCRAGLCQSSGSALFYPDAHGCRKRVRLPLLILNNSCDG